MSWKKYHKAHLHYFQTLKMASAVLDYDISSAVLTYDISNFCANCKLFQWKQPENRKTVRKCTRCQVVAYCSKECQEEHWHKVHRNHCKYLGGVKKADHSEHRKDTCKTCIASDSVGDLVLSPTNQPTMSASLNKSTGRCCLLPTLTHSH